MQIDQEKLAESCIHTVTTVDELLHEGWRTWASIRTVHKYMGYALSSKRQYQIINKFNIPTKKHKGKTYVLMDEYIKHAPPKKG